jgi:hypothetical protein
MKKRLLEEGTVRRFMKLASIGSHTDKFVNEGLYEDELETPEEGDEMLPPEGEEDPDAGLEPDLAAGAEGDLEGDLGGDLEGASGETTEVNVGDFMEDLGDLLELHLDREVTTTLGDEPAAADPAALGDEGGEVEADLDAAGVELGDEEPMEPEDEEGGMINEVTKRVARRLLRMSAKG